MKKATAWILGAAVLTTLVSLPGYGQTAQDVLNKLVGAMGGRKALEAVKDTTVTGTVDVAQYGISATITMYQKEPNKMRIDIDIAAAGMTITQAFDGEKGWWTNPQTGTTEEMPEAMAKDTMHQALGNDSFLNPQKLGITYALKPKAKIEDKDYIVLEQTLADGHKTTMYLDPTTYLPYKTTSLSSDMTGNEVETESFLTDYRKVGGLMVAHAIRNVQNGAEIQRITINSITYNANIDDAMFRMK